ncbi:hypothetical protein [Hymenobacter sp. DG25A]|uniref:hypothetical protein n=1 Tax=Hymenobacter sp. DG25A TaxID=1385663 RepID=UPI0012F86949|nr:hypothetical protein [Hymenobacter sp. DG25A]
MIRFYGFILTLFCSLSAYGQGLPGYIITMQGDTIRGDVAEKSGQRLYLYTSSENQPKILEADQVLGYGLEGNVPIFSRRVRMGSGSIVSCFVLPQQIGPASLYSFANDFGMLLLPAATDTLYELTATNWHVVLNKYLRACPTLQHTSSEILALSFSEANMQKVLTQYNQCIEPDWKPQYQSNKSAWKQAIGVSTNALRVPLGEEGFYGQKPSGWGGQFGVEWLAFRASGLQTIVKLDYSALFESTPPYQVISNGGTSIDIEERLRARLQFLSATLLIGKQIWPARRPNLIVGGGTGIDLISLGEVETEQRALGSTASFKVVSTSNNPGELRFHLDAYAGVSIPLSPRREVRLNAVYRHYIPDFGLPGIQLAYYWTLQ